jgi:hypothetical protein
MAPDKNPLDLGARMIAWRKPSLDDELELLRDEFPDYKLTIEFGRDRYRYISRSRRLDQNPHTVITDDRDELRDILHRAQAAETARLASSASE